MTVSKNAPTISLVIVTWNGKKYALECLDSLRAIKSSLKLEVIVVDNASTDGTKEAIRGSYPEVKLIENEANLGFAKANNIGIAATTGDYVCLVNSDVVVPPGCLEAMIAFMEGNRDVGLLGPKMLSPSGAVGRSVMRTPTVWNCFCSALGLHAVFPDSKYLGGFLMSGYKYDTIDDVDVLTGWFWMVPRAALSQVGGLDEQFFMYGEDIDWSLRFLRAGWRVVFYPAAEALHYGAASSGRAPARFYVEMRKANLQYFRKHHGRFGSLGYLLASWVHEIFRVLGYGLLFCFYRYRRGDAAFKISRSLSCIRWLTESGILLASR